MTRPDHIEGIDNRGGLIDDVLREPLTRRQALLRASAAGLAVTGISVITSACGAAAANNGSRSASSALVMTSGATPVTLDPMVSLDGQSPLLWRCVYEPLISFKGSTIDLQPGLAESYEQDSANNRVTFNLRSGVLFSDGTPLDAAGVKLNIERQIAVNQGIAYALTPIKSVETPDDHTVVVNLHGYSDGLIYGFASLYGLYLVSPKAITDHKGKDWAQSWLRSNMVGTGPYTLESYALNQQATFERNPKYWGGWSHTHFDRVIVEYVTDPSSGRLELQRGQSQIAFYLPDDVVYAMRKENDVEVIEDPSFNVYYLGLPCRTGPTANKAVRQAISYGFDYETFNRDILNGTATQARGPLPDIFPGYDPTLPQYNYDVDRARKMLAAAGHPGGGFSLKFIHETGYYWKGPLGEQFQSNMKDLGITVTLQELSPSTWVEILSNKQTANEAYAVVWWPSLAVPYDFLWALFATAAQGSAGYNFTYYSNPVYDATLAKATSESDEQQRMALYATCQRIVIEDAPYLFLSDANYLLPIDPKLKGFQFNGMYINTVDPYALSV